MRNIRGIENLAFVHFLEIIGTQEKIIRNKYNINGLQPVVPLCLLCVGGAPGHRSPEMYHTCI